MHLEQLFDAQTQLPFQVAELIKNVGDAFKFCCLLVNLIQRLVFLQCFASVTCKPPGRVRLFDTACVKHIFTLVLSSHNLTCFLERLIEILHNARVHFL